MPRRFRIILISFGLLLFLGSAPLKAQLLQDQVTLDLVKKDIDFIYNLQFDQAREVYAEIIRSYSGHPIAYLLRGMITYWENYPLLNTSPARASFEEDLRQCIRLSDANRDPDNEAEFLLSNLCARGLLLMFYDDNKLILEVTPLTISTYKFLRRAFDFTGECTDMYYFTGVYNFYREAYPRVYPIYKSLAILFPPGDIEAGLWELHMAAVNSIVLRPEACILLNWIYINFENKYPEALNYCRVLREHYPENGLFLATYIKSLLLMKKYDEAEKILSSVPVETGNKYFQAQLAILRGIIHEKKYLDYDKAQKYYNQGISDISTFARYGDEYAAYGYFGLSRISEAAGDKQTHKTYRKTAIKLADFKDVNFDR